MSRRNTGRPAGRAVSSSRRGSDWNTQEIDRYHTVDRDIYSGSSRRRSIRHARRKGGCLKKLFLLLLSVFLLTAGGAFLYFHIMASRLNRSDGTDSAQAANYTQLPSEAPDWSVKTDSNVTNILLLGVDENDNGTDGRSDTDLLLSIDSSSKALRMVSFLRDTYLEIPTVGKAKLNAAYPNGGAELVMHTLENNFRVGISKYVSVDFDSFQKIIDRMGGLDVPMTKAECQAVNENMGSHLSYPAAGQKTVTHHLDGRLCLYYARIRAIDNDFGRTGRQRQVVELMIKKLHTLNPLESTKILYDYLPYVKTNLSDSELLALAGTATKISDYKMETMHVPNDGAYENAKVSGADVLVPDLTKNSELLRNFLYGDDSSGASSN